MKFKIKPIVLTFIAIAFLTSCQSILVQPVQKNSAELVIESSYLEYLNRDADGTDINAMLSYFPLDLMTNYSQRFVWEDYSHRLNDYLAMAETEGISKNYTLVAGTNEIYIVSNFFSIAILDLKNSGTQLKEVPYRLSSMAQTLLLKIHNNEYQKNE